MLMRSSQIKEDISISSQIMMKMIAEEDWV